MEATVTVLLASVEEEDVTVAPVMHASVSVAVVVFKK